MRSIIFSLLLVSLFNSVMAQEKTDRHYPAPGFDYQAIQEQIDELSKDPQVSVYDLSLAQAWLNSSKYESWRNDSGWWPKESFRESERVVAAIKNKDGEALKKTSQLKIDQLVAPELWKEVQDIKKSPKACAKQLVARAEVQLVHAAYEAQETSWQDPTPQLSLAKSLIARSKACN